MALRTRLEAGDVDTTIVRRRLAELARALLARHPRDTELKHVTRTLAARDFVPAAPATLPRGTVAEVRRALLRRSAEELAALSAALVVVPDVANEPEAALAALELFVLVPAEAMRAAALATALEGRGHDVSLARFELALRTATAAAGHAVDLAKPESIVAALAEVSDNMRPEAQRRAAVRVLGALTAAGKAPYGSVWLVPCRDGTSIANHVPAFGRRPALRDELGIVSTWIEAPDAALAAAHTADRLEAGRGGADATALYEQLLDADDRARVLAGRMSLFATGGWASTLSSVVEPLQPRSALAARLERLATATPKKSNDDGEFAEADAKLPPEALDASAVELLGDRRAAALLWFQVATRDGATAAYIKAAGLASELRANDRRILAERLRSPLLADETKLAADADLRARAEILQTLDADPWLPMRLAVAAPLVAKQAPQDSDSAQATAPSVPESDPHHPDNRLAAASDLLAAGKLEPASNILAALVRKVDEHAPARLFTVVAQALEAEDEAPVDLVHAAQRALTDARRCPALLAALRKAPGAAFALHEDLIGFALDPSRNDVDRLLALEVWLGIWGATETAPDPDAIRTLRESEPALLVAAALRLGGQRDQVVALGRFLMAYPPATTDPEAFSSALLSASLGRA